MMNQSINSKKKIAMKYFPSENSFSSTLNPFVVITCFWVNFHNLTNVFEKMKKGKIIVFFGHFFEI